MSIKNEEKRRRQDAAGIPDSKPFAAPFGELTGADRILECHISGVSIRDMNLEPHVIAVLDYWATDEGVEEKNARPNVREASGVRLGADGFDKSLDQRRDDVKDRDMDLYMARDPFKEKADAFVKPGMRPKMLSASKLKQGSGDHEIVKYPQGHPQAGDPVMVRNMVLGEIPERMAVARNKHYRNKANDLLTQVEARHKAQGGVVGATNQSGVVGGSQD